MKDRHGPRSCFDFFSHGTVGAEMPLYFWTEPGLPGRALAGFPCLSSVFLWTQKSGPATLSSVTSDLGLNWFTGVSPGSVAKPLSKVPASPSGWEWSRRSGRTPVGKDLPTVLKPFCSGGEVQASLLRFSLAQPAHSREPLGQKVINYIQF